MKISFNAPAVLIFTIVACIVQLLNDYLFPGFTNNYFAVSGYFNWSDPLDYFRIWSHAIGHGGWEHLVGNFSFILLIGPILEEKYGTKNLLLMMFFTALITGILNNVFWNTGLAGASGIVFMMILLGSLVNLRTGTIPLTFILIVVLYLGREIYTAVGQPADHISQFAHVIGGVCGMLFGFALSGNKVPVTVTGK